MTIKLSKPTAYKVKPLYGSNGKPIRCTARWQFRIVMDTDDPPNDHGLPRSERYTEEEHHAKAKLS